MPPQDLDKVPSLQAIAVVQLAAQLPGLLATRAGAMMPTLLPAPLKEAILREAAHTGVLTDARLALFHGANLERLDLRMAPITVDGLKAVVRLRRNARPALAVPQVPVAGPPVNDWEELAALEPVHTPTASGARVTWLAVDACMGLEGVPFAHLVTVGLPMLRHLSVAACFTVRDGPDAMRILADGVPTLLTLDAGHFDVYQGPIHEQAVKAEAEWLAGVLGA